MLRIKRANLKSTLMIFIRFRLKKRFNHSFKECQEQLTEQVGKFLIIFPHFYKIIKNKNLDTIKMPSALYKFISSVDTWFYKK